MGQRTETFITCDNCQNEERYHSSIPNLVWLKKAAKSVGFITTTKNQFCTEKCKSEFKAKED